MTLLLDCSLLDAFRRGDLDALERVYWRYVRDVERLVRLGFHIDERYVRGLSRSQDQCEAVQETFLRAFAEKARLAYNGLSLYKPYLLRIARNALIDRFRRSSARKEVALDPSFDMQRDPTPGEELDADPQWQALSAATREYLATVTDQERHFVELRFEQELSQLDVANRLGVSRKVVRTLEKRVNAGLARFLRSKGVRP